MSRLPAPVASMVGRDGLLRSVRAALGEARLVTLVGPGGVGKSRLALAVAHACGDDFRDGVRFLGLDALAPRARLLPPLAEALGLRESGDTDLLLRVSDALAPLELLFVLDGCEHLPSVGPTVAALLADCPGLRVLATSRTPLNVRGERVEAVPTLPAAEALALLEVRGRTACPGLRLDADEGAALCARLDGLPLALELASARLRALSPARLLEELRAGVPLGPGPVDAPERQRTLRACVAWSYELLGLPDQALLRRLSLLGGPFSLETARGVAGGEVLEGLASLVEASLVERVGEEYRLLETVRTFAAEERAARGEELAGQEALLAFATSLAESAEPHLATARQVEWLERLAREHDRIAAALRWATAEGRAGAALRLGAAVWRSWMVRGALAEGRALLEAALNLPGASEPALTVTRARVLLGTGALAHGASLYQVAEGRYTGAEALFDYVGGRPGVLAARVGLGLAVGARGDTERGRTLCREAVSGARAVGEPGLLAHALFAEALQAALSGDAAGARPLAEEALALQQGRGDPRGTAFAVYGLGYIELALDRLDAASDCFDEALGLLRLVGDRRALTMCLNGLGEVERRRGGHARARALHEEALAIAVEVGDCWNLAYCLEGFAALELASGQARAAVRWLGAVETLREAMGAPTPPFRKGELDRALSALYVRLEEEPLAAARAEGRVASISELLARQVESRVSAGVDELTAREREVLREVATGASDADVATRLFVSIRTVHGHLRSIYGKLGVRSRTAATRAALERGLTS